MSDSLRPHESQHSRPPCPSPSSRVHSNSRPIESVMPSSHLILCHPLLFLPPIPPSISVFSNESTLRVRWPKYWSFSFSIIPSKEIPGLIFRMMSFRIFPILVFLIYFSCLIELPRTFSKILDKGGVSRYSCLLSDPGGTYSPLHVEYDVNCRFWQMYSVMKKVPLHS